MKFMTEYLRDLTSLASKVEKVLYQGKCGQNGHNLVWIGKFKIFWFNPLFSFSK